MKKYYLRGLLLARRLVTTTALEIRYYFSRSFALGVDLVHMIDVNDFGRILSKNLSKRFLALSGVVTLFALIGDYTKRFVFGQETDVALSQNLLETLIANFLFFGVPGGLLLLITQVFCFFNRSNYFTAQANYLNLLEAYKRSPTERQKILHKLWEHVFQEEQTIFAGNRSHEEMCETVKQLEESEGEEAARLLRGCTPAAETELAQAARQKYAIHRRRLQEEGYTRVQVWKEMSHRERAHVLSQILREETATTITRKNLCYCHRGFLFNANWSLSRSMHLNMKHQKSGIDLKLVEDWMDGACFDITDTKLVEQYIAEATLRSVKIQSRVPVLSFIALQGIRTYFQRIWTYMVFGITSKRLGRYLNHLNHRFVLEESATFDRDYFKAEAFLWPSEAYDREIRKELGEPALERLQALRQRWLFLTLGKLKMPRINRRTTLEEAKASLEKNRDKTLKNAARLLHRMFAGSVQNIHELRLRYDPDYVIQIYNREPGQIAGMELNLHSYHRKRKTVRKHHRQIQRFLAVLPSLLESRSLERHGLQEPINLEAERAIRVAYHINENNLKTWIDRDLGQGSHPAARERIFAACARVANNRRSYSRKIRQLKIFETLAIHHLKVYQHTVRKLYSRVTENYWETLRERIRNR